RRVTTIQSPKNEVTTITYLDDVGQRLITDARNEVTTLTLDGFGNIAQVETPEGITNQYTWNARQRLESFTDGRNFTRSFTYTTLYYQRVGRLTAIQKPEGGNFGLQYDPTGPLSTITDENSNVTTLQWDSQRNRTGVINADGYGTGYGYSALGQIEQVENHLGFV